MKILSHRGFWRTPDEKNGRAAFRRTLEEGFGTETDVRDLLGELVVAHDPPKGGEMAWADLMAMFEGSGLPLAVNVKADGLAPRLKAAFQDSSTPWFAFDMSGPETVRYAREGLPFYTRHSDVEPEPILYREAAGVWLDSFGDDSWIEAGVIGRHLDAGKAVCLVSSDLHGRDPAPLWERIASLASADGLTLCTDAPDRAKTEFAL